jgi:hypothetical protein
MKRYAAEYNAANSLSSHEMHQVNWRAFDLNLLVVFDADAGNGA